MSIGSAGAWEWQWEISSKQLDFTHAWQLLSYFKGSDKTEAVEAER